MKILNRITEKLSERLQTRKCYWEYFPSGWFGNKVIEGSITSGDKVLAVPWTTAIKV